MTTPNMALDLPVTSVTPGPTYSVKINTALTTIDAHDHTSGAGVQIPSAGITIDANLSFNSYSPTSVKSLVFASQSTVTTSGALWEKSTGDLWWTNGSGTQVQITSAGALNTAALITSIWTQYALAGNLVIGASDTYTHYLVSSAAARSITLPAASGVTAGRFYVFTDSTGSAATNNITINRAGSDTIEGDASHILAENYGSVILVSDGTSKWSVAGGSIANRVKGSKLWFAKAVSNPSIEQVAQTSGGATQMSITAQSSSGGNGGALALTSGASTGSNGVGGAMSVTAGAGNGSGGGGDVTIQSGAGGSTGSGGGVTIKLGGDAAGSARNIIRAVRGSSGGDYVLIGTGNPSYLSEASTDKPTIYISDCGALPASSGILLNSVSGAPWFSLSNGDQFGLTGYTANNASTAAGKSLKVTIGATTYYIQLYSNSP
jgi:hypothetical protein